MSNCFELYIILKLRISSFRICLALKIHVWQLFGGFSDAGSHIVSWEPEGRYCRSKTFRWEPEGRYCHILCTAIASFWLSTEHLWVAITPFWLSTDDISWAERQKGINAVRRCSVENQKVDIAINFFTAISPFWFSTEHLWTSALLALNWRYYSYQLFDT